MRSMSARSCCTVESPSTSRIHMLRRATDIGNHLLVFWEELSSAYADVSSTVYGPITVVPCSGKKLISDIHRTTRRHVRSGHAGARDWKMRGLHARTLPVPFLFPAFSGRARTHTIAALDTLHHYLLPAQEWASLPV